MACTCAIFEHKAKGTVPAEKPEHQLFEVRMFLIDQER